MNKRAEHEIQHGKLLAEGDTETLWGWGTPAGRLRARRRAELIGTGAQLSNTSRVLEIGCGTGMFTEMFSQAGCSIVAVDISETLLCKAEERKLPKEQVRFVQKRFEDCKEDGPFDAVIGSSVLHHLELHEAIPKIYELLKPNGIMSFAEPNMMNPQVFIERNLRSFFPYISPDETAFIRWNLVRDLKKAGFCNIQIVPFDWLHPSVPEKLIGAVSTVGNILEQLPFVREFSGSLHIRAIRPSV
uniref:class I SAM-dependent methyltransferase n=1 Tax=Candidatus Electronema sp. TaxID=2698783 RepID=UPI004056DB64